MKTEDIIRMARQAADELPGYTSKVKDPSGAALKFYKKFAAIVAAAEREACAKIVDDSQDGITFIGDRHVTVATAIRARGQA